MQIQEVLKRSYELTSWLDHSIHGVSIQTSLRNSIAVGCFDIVHEHRKSILLLVENRLVGSAFSLVRPEFETFVRGVWALRCASEKDLANFENDRIESTLGQLIEAIERLDPWAVGLLSGIKKSAWSSMCSYAHGGALQIGRRFRNDEIAPNYSNASIIVILNSSNVIALLSASEIAAVANDSNLGVLVNEKLSTLLSAQP